MDTKVRTLSFVALLSMGGACDDDSSSGESDLGGAGNITLEVAVGPEWVEGDGNQTVLLTAVRLVYAEPDEESVHGGFTIAEEDSAAINGIYGTGGQIDQGHC